jgi:membrane-bound serine protease (ClpP class)
MEFFLPGGILALCALLLALAGTSLFFWATPALWLCAVYLSVLIAAALAICLLALRMIRKSKDSFCLHEDQEGFVASSFEEDLTGKKGVVTTELKPAGHVRIEGVIYQALSQGDFIVKAAVVEVVATKGSHLVVKLKK